jgi:hypothetical protein
MAVQFVVKVEYLNSEDLPLGKYPLIQMDKEVSPRMPEFVPSKTLVEGAQAKSSGLGTVYGDTLRYLYVEFDDFKSQWKKVPVKGIRNLLWQFQGGAVNLVMASKVLVLDTLNPNINRDPKMSNNIAFFALVMEHEFHHVADNIKVLNKAMPSAALDDAIAKNYLVNARPIDDGFFQKQFEGYASRRSLTDEVFKLDYAPPKGCGFEVNLNREFQEKANEKGAEYHQQVMKRYIERRGELSLAHQTGRPWKGGPGKDPWKDY